MHRTSGGGAAAPGRRGARLAAAATGVALALCLAACAPEPGDVAGAPDKGSETPNGESSWGETGSEDLAPKQTEIPQSFPRDAFPIPEGAVVDDTGERSADQWFVVLRAADPADADALWSEIVAAGGFSVGDEQETVEGGRIATLESATLSVQAITIPQSDDSMLLSFDLSRIG
ncbi:hypothetical protein JD276_03130 [Leucobacter sp. CSA1]|uniref:Uncharacterized protein n=1 Tax=Leucobacter chromiisoli TaxID=2796471 RepID=A0A934Q5I1_9MICO|nr:hypothetical protein [Leucobacter chromiisoli]MBK0418028.1 hypothetical protein [Leucobacter chromiisoli]